MPNIKSAKKRVLVTEKKTMQNKTVKSALKTTIKKFLAAVNEGNKEQATALYPETVSAIDSAVTKGILHKNNAANKKAKLAKKLAALSASIELNFHSGTRFFGGCFFVFLYLIIIRRHSPALSENFFDFFISNS